MSCDALRKGRCSLPGQVYCITTVTRNRARIFNNLAAARLLIQEIRRLHDAGQVNSQAFVVMPDHLHWLLQLGDELELSDVVKRLKARSARVINLYLGRTGQLWQRAYHDRALRADDDVRVIARYIVANPLRARLVDAIGEYPHWDCIWLDGDASSLLVE